MTGSRQKARKDSSCKEISPAGATGVRRGEALKQKDVHDKEKKRLRVSWEKMIEKDDEGGREGGGGYQASLRVDQSDWGRWKGVGKGEFESEHGE